MSVWLIPVQYDSDFTALARSVLRGIVACSTS